MTKEELELRNIYNEIGLDSPDSELQSLQKIIEEDAIICRACMSRQKEIINDQIEAAEREAVIDEMLKIIDETMWDDERMQIERAWNSACRTIKEKVLALKGGEQK